MFLNEDSEHCHLGPISDQPEREQEGAAREMRPETESRGSSHCNRAKRMEGHAKPGEVLNRLSYSEYASYG